MRALWYKVTSTAEVLRESFVIQSSTGKYFLQYLVKALLCKVVLARSTSCELCSTK